jgi:hypothetical protein
MCTARLIIFINSVVMERLNRVGDESNCVIYGVDSLLLVYFGQNVVLPVEEVLLLVLAGDFGAAVVRQQDRIADLEAAGHALAVGGGGSGADGDHGPLVGLVLLPLGDHDAALGLHDLVRLLDEHAI